MSEQLSLCVIGDLVLDIVTHLPELSLEAAHTLKSFSGPSPVQLQVGGAGLLLSRAAVRQGFSPVTVIGSVGVQPTNGQPDLAAQLIMAELQQDGIQSVLAKDEQTATGRVMITYFAESERLMVYDRGANESLTLDKLTPESLDTAAQADILFVSGYALLVPEQAEAVLRLMQEAYNHRRLVVLDLVPHDIYQHIDADTFRAYTACVHVLISEVGTIRRLFPALQDNHQDSDYTGMAAYLTPIYPVVILYPSYTNQYIFDRHGLIAMHELEYTGSGYEQGLSFGERMSLLALQNHYRHFVTISNDRPGTEHDEL
jgi:sugar/nucleoside kinase (ribokinase family)